MDARTGAGAGPAPACVSSGATRGADRSWAYDPARGGVVQPAGRVLEGSADLLDRMP